MLNGSVVHTNFLGIGNRVALELVSGKFQKLYSLSHTDPYRSMDGIRRTVAVNYRDITQFTSASSDFSTTSAGATIDYGYPLTELLASTSSTQQAQDWVLNNGNPFIESSGVGFSFFGTEYDAYELIAGWSFDSRNRALFATRGTRQQFVLSYTVPGSDVEYYTARYNFKKYFPL